MKGNIINPLLGTLLILGAGSVSAHAGENSLTLLPKVVKAFTCEADDFRLLKKIIVDTRVSQLKSESQKTYDATELLNKAITAKCSKAVRVKCCGANTEAEVKEIHGFAYHRDLYGPIESLGIKAFYLSGRAGGDPDFRGSHYYEVTIDPAVATEAIDCFIKKLK